MVYSNAEEVRRVTGLDPTDATDDELIYFIGKATKQVIVDITGKKDWDVLDGDLDGSNKVFYTSNYPLADTDGDQAITVDALTTYGTEELAVYEWTDRTDETTKTRVKVSALDISIGKITLDTAPDSDVDIVTCNYRYHTIEPDWDLVDEATALLAGYKYALSEYLFIPDREKTGGITYVFTTQPYKRIKDEYDQAILKIKGAGMKVENVRDGLTISELESRQRDSLVD